MAAGSAGFVGSFVAAVTQAAGIFATGLLAVPAITVMQAGWPDALVAAAKVLLAIP